MRGIHLPTHPSSYINNQRARLYLFSFLFSSLFCYGLLMSYRIFPNDNEKEFVYA